MNEFDPIPLNTNWRINESNTAVSLSKFSVIAGQETILHHTFDLEPIGEFCLRFFLHIESAPDSTTVDMNRWQVGMTQTGQPFIADVTDYVTLEDNILLLKVNQPGAFGAIWLERVPCEKLS